MIMRTRVAPRRQFLWWYPGGISLLYDIEDFDEKKERAKMVALQAREQTV